MRGKWCTSQASAHFLGFQRWVLKVKIPVSDEVHPHLGEKETRDDRATLGEVTKELSFAKGGAGDTHRDVNSYDTDLLVARIDIDMG